MAAMSLMIALFRQCDMRDSSICRLLQLRPPIRAHSGSNPIDDINSGAYMNDLGYSGFRRAPTREADAGEDKEKER